MAKVRRYRPSWEPSESQNIIGYKIYWSRSESVNYDSEFIDVGNVTEMELADDILFVDNPIMFGVTAIDRDGNESDITTLVGPYTLHVPKAPTGLSLIHTAQFKVLEYNELAADQGGEEDPLADAIESHESQEQKKMKYYNDVGYRGPRS